MDKGKLHVPLISLCSPSSASSYSSLGVVRPSVWCFLVAVFLSTFPASVVFIVVLICQIRNIATE